MAGCATESRHRLPAGSPVIVLPVFNATGTSLGLSRDERLGTLEAVLASETSDGPTVPELLQAGMLLALDAADHKAATMAWTNSRFPGPYRSGQQARQAVEKAAVEGLVVWMALTAWDHTNWRERRAVTLSAEFVTFQPRQAGSVEIRVVRHRRFLIPGTFSSLAQAVGDVGGQLIREGVGP
ncbi:MAG: hypothetical protein ACREI3_01980 [Nitrospirales bacterium]